MMGRHPFTWRHFEAEIMFLCVRWFSSGDLEEMMRERGVRSTSMPT